MESWFQVRIPANDLKLSSKTVSKYIDILEQAFIIKILYNYSANQLTSEKKMKRVYLTSPSFCTALHDFANPGKLVENALLSLKPYRFFWRDSYNHEVDFVDIKENSVVPVEVKYKTKIRTGDYNNLFLFCNKFGAAGAEMLINSVEAKKVEHKGLPIELKSIYITMKD